MLELAPAPAVDDEPSATMVIGSPLASLRATCFNGTESRIRSCRGLHGGVPEGSAWADSGATIDANKVTTASR